MRFRLWVTKYALLLLLIDNVYMGYVKLCSAFHILSVYMI